MGKVSGQEWLDVGDKVRVLQDKECDPAFIGKEGTIVSNDGWGAMLCRIS